MPRLDDTAIEEGLQHLPGWERRGSEIVKTFVRADFAQAMVLSTRSPQRPRRPATILTSTSAGTRSPWPCPATPRVG